MFEDSPMYSRTIILLLLALSFKLAVAQDWNKHAGIRAMHIINRDKADFSSPNYPHMIWPIVYITCKIT